VGGGEFVFPDAVDITGIRWYGYYNCKIDPVGHNLISVFISFLSDSDGLPASESIYSQQVQAHVREPTVRVVPSPASAFYYQVYVHTVDSLPPLSILPGRRTWISISEAPSSCEWIWNRGSSGDTGNSAWGDRESSGRFSKWRQLEGDLAFAVYGRKIRTAAR
jgi:hypothetical protein